MKKQNKINYFVFCLFFFFFIFLHLLMKKRAGLSGVFHHHHHYRFVCVCVLLRPARAHAPVRDDDQTSSSQRVPWQLSSTHYVSPPFSQSPFVFSRSYRERLPDFITPQK